MQVRCILLRFPNDRDFLCLLGYKQVIAVYPFTAIEPGDLTLAKGEEYLVLDDSQEHWWQVENKSGEMGFIPSNYVKEKDALGLQNFDW